MNDELYKAIIHDIEHKPLGKAHRHGTVKLSTTADSDASIMSRRIKGKINWDENKVSHYRISLITNKSFYDAENFNLRTYWEDLEDIYLSYNGKVENLYKTLLKCDITSKFNEIGISPYTSLKYHSILVTNLTWNYLKKRKFDDLYFQIAKTEDIENIFSVIHKTDEYSLLIDELKPYSTSYTKIGVPMPNFGNVLSRMNGKQPFKSHIFANLRRIQSWSIGLQYMEDVVDVYK